MCAEEKEKGYFLRPNSNIKIILAEMISIRGPDRSSLILGFPCPCASVGAVIYTRSKPQVARLRCAGWKAILAGKP